MKTFRVVAAALAIVGIQLTIASPTLTGLEVRKANEVGNLPYSDMKWSGRIFAADTKDTVLSGDAKSIWHQIIALNPNYAKENGIPDPTEAHRVQHHVPATANSAALETREEGRINCDVGIGPVMVDKCDEGLAFLRALGNGQQMCTVGSQSCVRVSCSWNCGIHICSTNDDDLAVLCRDVATDVNIIIDQCAGKGYPFPFFVHGQLIFGNHYTQLQYDDC